MSIKRHRRLRATGAIRNLVRETSLTRHDLIQPFFIVPGSRKAEEIPSMPGIRRYSVDRLLKQVEAYIKVGGQAGLFFGVPEDKEALPTAAYDEQGLVPQAVRELKRNFPDFLVITDVCLCAYTAHGHCGVVRGQQIDNDISVELLVQMAAAHAAAGADIVAPSDMMDGRIFRIREDLDHSGLSGTAIMSYAAKYASAFYGPFRDAAQSAPAFGDRKSYQMDSANAREAVKEALQDVEEGADIIMVKPALAYLDILARLRPVVNVPLAAYHVSGEYAMIKAAAQNGWIDERQVTLESLTAIKRAGVDVIVTYCAKDVMEWLKGET